MKRRALLAHRRKHGCYPKREGRSHSLWTNPETRDLALEGDGADPGAVRVGDAPRRAAG